MSVPDPAAVDWVPLWTLDPGVAPTLRARAFKSADQPVNHATATLLAFGTEVFDNDTIHDTVTNNSRLTCKTAGLYLVRASVVFSANPSGLRLVSFAVNGSTAEEVQMPACGGGAVSVVPLSAIIQLAVGDYVEVSVYQDSGATLNALVIHPGYGTPTYFEMERIGVTSGTALPQPVVNGQWLKGVGGAAVWSAIAESDVTGLTTDLAAKFDAAKVPAAGFVNSNGTVAQAGWGGWTVTHPSQGNYTISLPVSTTGFVLITPYGQSVVSGGNVQGTAVFVYMTTPSAWIDSPFGFMVVRTA